jgi:hypothetical protein
VPLQRNSDKETTMDTTTATAARPPFERRPARSDTPRPPHTIHLRELVMPDGRRLLLDRRSIAFLCEDKSAEFDGREVTIVAFKTPARACPVVASYDDLSAWWRGPEAGKGGAP